MYTRTGDKGETGLFSGERVPKNSLRVEAYGTVDELSSTIGRARSLIEDREIDEILEKVQRDLFLVGAELATLPKSRREQKFKVTDTMVKYLEEQTDRLAAELAPLSTFIVPAGTEAATALHVARTVARRAERRAVTLAQKEQLDSQVLPYLNRLSSLLFVLAMIVNHRSGVDEVKWSSRSQQT
jgi:cob(I)alamin adenosyltransferase